MPSAKRRSMNRSADQSELLAHHPWPAAWIVSGWAGDDRGVLENDAFCMWSKYDGLPIEEKFWGRNKVRPHQRVSGALHLSSPSRPSSQARVVSESASMPCASSRLVFCRVLFLASISKPSLRPIKSRRRGGAGGATNVLALTSSPRPWDDVRRGRPRPRRPSAA